MKGKPILIAVLMMGLFVVAANCQTDVVAANDVKEASSQETTKAVAKSAITEVRGISLGMTGDEVKEKLGKPKIEDKDGLYFVLSDSESLQIQLDADHKVKVASMIYSGKKSEAPEVGDVFGANTAVTPGADGRIYELVRYPDAGYWISYSRIMLDDGPMTTVTLQKMR